MSNPLRIRQIRRAFLQALTYSGGYAVPEEILWSHVDDLIQPPLSYTEKGVTTAFFKAQGDIVNVQSDIDPGLKQWAITAKGKTTLATL